MTSTKTPEQAVSLDEYIESHRASITADNLRELGRHVKAFERKAEQAGAEMRADLLRGIRLMVDLFGSQELVELRDPLPSDVAELGVAAHYLLKGFDLIPDSLAGIGLADDEWIVVRVMERNPGLRQRAWTQLG
jgi:uncharacterized membrane protein YkvA (DUF1232 family)